MRDLEILSKVAKELPEFEFHLVAKKAKLEKRDNIIIHQGIPDEELLKLNQESDILLMPLINATANNGIMEGIACGLPVLTTDLESTREYLNSDCAMFCKTSEDFKKAII